MWRFVGVVMVGVLSLLQASAVEAMPNLAQQRKKELASALFGGLSGPARPVKMKGRSAAMGGGGSGGVASPKKATQKEELERSGGPDLLLDLQVRSLIVPWMLG